MRATNGTAAAAEGITALALPCGHEVVLPADLPAPAIAYYVLGHQMGCQVAEGGTPAGADLPSPVAEERRRLRRSDARFQATVDRPSWVPEHL